jgi:hypothetical protein
MEGDSGLAKVLKGVDEARSTILEPRRIIEIELSFVRVAPFESKG